MSDCKCETKISYFLILLIVLFFGNCSGHSVGRVYLQPDQKVKCEL